MGAALVQGQGLLGTQPDVHMRTTAMATALVRGLILVPFVRDVTPSSAHDLWCVLKRYWFGWFGWFGRFGRFGWFWLVGLVGSEMCDVSLRFLNCWFGWFRNV
jgi:hypothetical protein